MPISIAAAAFRAAIDDFNGIVRGAGVGALADQSTRAHLRDKMKEWEAECLEHDRLDAHDGEKS